MYRNAPLVCPVGMGMISYYGALCMTSAPADACCTRGYPIRPGRGAKVFNETDLVDPAGTLTFSRTYNSFGFDPPGKTPTPIPPNVLGRMWRTPFDSELVPIAGSSYVIAAIIRPDGGIKYFRQDGSEYPHFPGTPVETLVANSDGTWTLTTGSDGVDTYDAGGRLVALWDKQHLQRTLSYDSNGRLSTVSDSRGRTLAFSFVVAPDSSQTVTVTTPGGQQAVYAIDSRSNLTSVTFPDGAVRAYVYESTATNNYAAITGVIDKASASDPGSRYETVQYDDSGHATSSFLAPNVANGTIGLNTFTYNPNGTTTQVDPLGNSTTLQFTTTNGVLNLTSESQLCGTCGGDSVKARIYDAAGYLYSQTDFNGNVTRYTYDDTRGLETQRIEANATSAQRTTNTTWDANFRVPDQRSVVNASNVTESLTKWAYNSRGQVLSRCEIDPTVSAATSYTCGSSGSAPIGVRQTSYTYCEQAAVTAGTCPLVGLILTVTSPRTDVSSVTTYSYYQTTDLSGCATVGGMCHYLSDLYQVSNALGQTTTYVSYDKNGRVTRTKDANGTITDLTYSPRGWLLTRTVRANADGSASSSDAITTFGYDNVGQVTKITQPDGAYLSYTYDAAHRLTDITDNLSNAIHYTLDAAGNRTNETTKDPTGTLTRALSRQYDQLNHLTKTLNAANTAVQTYQNPAEASPSGITYTNGYDGNGNAIYSVDGNGVGSEQQVDPLNRLVKTLQDHAGTGATKDTATQYAYDARDHLRSVTDPDGLITNYTYDGLNNLTQLQSPDTGSSSYTYDAAGNRISQTDARGTTTTYTYDVLNRLTGIAYPTSSLNVTYAYDQRATGCFNVGRLTTITDSSGSTVYCYDRRGNVTSKQQTANGVVSTLSYTYTVADRLNTMTYPSGAIVGYARNVLGQITAITYQPNATASAQTLISAASYLPFGPLSQITFGNGRTLSKHYDQDYAISQVVSSDPNGLVIGATVDVLGNLTSAVNTIGTTPPTQSYQYDPLYRLTTSQTGATPPSPLENYTYGKTGDRTSAALNGATATSYTYTAGTHRLQSVGTNARTYDANGNTQSANGNTFTYDDRNRLSALNAGAPTGIQASYSYNGKGERVAKLVGTAGQLQTATTFVYGEGGQLLGEYAGGNSQEYVYLDGVPVGIVTATTGTSGTTNQMYYVETDQLGAPRAAVQPGATTSADSVIWKWDYFGSTFGTHQPSVQTLTINLRFPGQYYDTELGTHYNYYRDYDPTTGRYVESDPLGLAGGPSTYGYAGGSSLNAIDPKGKLTFGPSCGYNQRAKIMIAFLDLWNDLFKNACMSCQGERCMPCDQAQRAIGWLLSSAHVSCDGFEGYIPGHRNLVVACGDVPHVRDMKGNIIGGMNNIQLAPSDVSIGWPPCGCLKSSLLHEAIHHDHAVFGGYDKDDDAEENNTRKQTQRCIPCARGDFQ